MKKFAWAIVIAAIVLLVVSIAYETRWAAGLGALLLLVAIIYGFVRNRGGSRAEIARAERGAEELRHDLERDPEYREE